MRALCGRIALKMLSADRTANTELPSRVNCSSRSIFSSGGLQGATTQSCNGPTLSNYTTSESQ